MLVGRVRIMRVVGIIDSIGPGPGVPMHKIVILFKCD